MADFAAPVGGSKAMRTRPWPIRCKAASAASGMRGPATAMMSLIRSTLIRPTARADAALRPNQLLAVSLPHSPLKSAQQRAIVDSCARRLVTSLGLRSLAPEDPAYIGRFQGGTYERDSAYHQGTVWTWLIGPFVEAHLRVYSDPTQAQQFLLPFIHHLSDYGVGSISEVAEGDAPHRPRACIAQAWSVAEVLRVWDLL